MDSVGRCVDISSAYFGGLQLKIKLIKLETFEDGPKIAKFSKKY
jgi:hypothetical protein